MYLCISYKLTGSVHTSIHWPFSTVKSAVACTYCVFVIMIMCVCVVSVVVVCPMSDPFDLSNNLGTVVSVKSECHLSMPKHLTLTLYTDSTLLHCYSSVMLLPMCVCSVQAHP